MYCWGKPLALEVYAEGEFSIHVTWDSYREGTTWKDDKLNSGKFVLKTNKSGYLEESSKEY